MFGSNGILHSSKRSGTTAPPPFPPQGFESWTHQLLVLHLPLTCSQTFTYSMKAICDSLGSADTAERLPKGQSLSKAAITGGGTAAEGSSASCHSASSKGTVVGFEVRIVLELCDLGSLRQLLDRGAFRSEDGSLNYPAVLETAADIAKGMAQLHSLNIVHSDLKVRPSGVLPIVS